MVDRFTFLVRASSENERSPKQLVDISAYSKNYFGIWGCSVDSIWVKQFENMLSNAC